ncbi:MAG: hypothetical protein PHR06_07890 [Candidatus Cloacimonetes bacterium]|nr:hypothetical protein [Candidatus Cloacimonadota bacterium]
MRELREEIEKRRQIRRSGKTSGWFSLLIKIILLFLILSFAGFVGREKLTKLKNVFFGYTVTP